MKKIKWANKELPGLPHEELAKLTVAKLVAREKALSLSSNPEILKKRGKAISKANKGRVNDMSHLNTKQAKDNWRKSIDLDELAKRCRANAEKRRVKVKAYKDGKYIQTFDSMLDACQALPICCASIGNILNPNHKTVQVKGYTFEYA